ncbi:unnamed protein product [Anisakis simplex]|uniref:Protein DEK (inferred by orthology to a human protein) n=1 Tax=Anisakis simplex TaxID=6269 RepID=A0A0M3JXP2_ANISI|nr:unnamed protein product [Anisakis simplex]
MKYTQVQGELDKSVIVEGKRKRHAVERMVINIDTPSRKPKIAAPGLGIALGDIPYVKETLEKTKCVMLKGMFRLCYGRVGNRASMKKELRTFTGFPFDDSDTQFQKRKAIAQKLSVAEVIRLFILIQIFLRVPHFSNNLISCSSFTQLQISNILMFLLKPTDLGKSPESLVKRKKGSKKRKRQTKKEAKKGDEVRCNHKIGIQYLHEMGKARKLGKKSEPKAKRQKKSEEVESSDGGGDSSDEEDNNDDSGGETENAHEKASVTKKSTAHNTGGAHKKTLSKGTDKHKKKETEHESKWGNGGPTDVELNAEIDMLLHTMDLSQATMKEMCVEIACKFPNLNMDKYKSALKQRIKTALDKLDA